MISAALFISEHSGAVNADTMRFLGCTVEQARTRFGWRGLVDFIEHAPADSAIVAEVAPEYSTRGLDVMRAELLARLFDALAWVHYSLLKRWGGHPDKPRALELPWRKGARQKRYGRGAIPVEDFDRWYYGEG